MDFKNQIFNLINEAIAKGYESDFDEMKAKTDIEIQKVVSDENGEFEYYIKGTFGRDIYNLQRATHDQPAEYEVDETGVLSVEVAIIDKDGEEIHYDEILENYKS